MWNIVNAFSRETTEQSKLNVELNMKTQLDIKILNF